MNLYHLHIDPVYAEQDLNCLFPVQRLNELEQLGEIGSAAPRHYSFMGYIVDPDELLQETTPAIIRDLRREQDATERRRTRPLNEATSYMANC